MLMVNADCYTATRTTERLLNAVDGWSKDYVDTHGCRLSFSMGCATCENDGNVYAALSEADERMYWNKKEKRNNVKRQR